MDLIEDVRERKGSRMNSKFLAGESKSSMEVTICKEYWQHVPTSHTHTHTHTCFIEELMNSVTYNLAFNSCTCLAIPNTALKSNILQAHRETPLASYT